MPMLYYTPKGTIRADDLFDGRLEKYGIRELILAEPDCHTDEHTRFLEHDGGAGAAVYLRDQYEYGITPRPSGPGAASMSPNSVLAVASASTSSSTRSRRSSASRSSGMVVIGGTAALLASGSVLIPVRPRTRERALIEDDDPSRTAADVIGDKDVHPPPEPDAEQIWLWCHDGDEEWG